MSDSKLGILKILDNSNQRLTVVLCLLVALFFSAIVLPAYSEADDLLVDHPRESIQLSFVTKAFLFGNPYLWPTVFTGLLVVVIVVSFREGRPELVKKFNLTIFVLSLAWVLTFIYSIADSNSSFRPIR